MKHLVLFMAFAILTTFQVSAQDDNKKMNAQQRTEQRIKKLDEKLSLTDDQKTKIRTLYANFNKQKYPREKRREAMKKLTDSITLVLSADQQALYKEMMTQAAAEMKNKPRKKPTE